MAHLAGGLGGAGGASQLEQGPFDYVAGGAGSEATVQANRDAFERRRLRPRMLTGNAERDLGSEALGPAFAGAVPARRRSANFDPLHPEAEFGVRRRAARR